MDHRDPPLTQVVPSLSHLFSLLPSPVPASHTGGSKDWLADQAQDILDHDDAIPELKTRLHRYQRRTVVVMLQRENGLGPVRGGILCEEMGTGKTLEVLSVICSMRGAVPSLPPTGKIDPDCCETLRDHSPLPTLAALSLRSVRYSTIPIRWMDHLDVLPLSMATRLEEATPSFVRPPPILPRQEYARSNIPRYITTPTRIFLSPATIVLVPSTLMSHWQDEISKHVHTSKLRVLLLASLNDAVPPAKDLADKWDLILCSYEKFAKEADRLIAVPSVGAPRSCECRYIAASRTKNCQCIRPRIDPSPFMLCGFKRIVIDEGNKMSGHSKLVQLALKLDVECRWIVSGTPTEGLTAAGTEDWSSVERAIAPQTPIKNLAKATRSWSEADRRDIEDRLFRLVVQFLRLPPYCDDPNPIRLWQHTVVRPLFADKSTSPPLAAVQALFDILKLTMVRNRPADVALDRPLPPLHRHYIPITLSPVERKTFNMIQALLSANAILTQREGQDYFFHPANRKWVSEILTNLWLCCFHFAGPDREQQAVESVKYLQEKLQPGSKWANNEDLQAAYAQLKEALDDPRWRSQSVEVDYSIANLDPELWKAWRRDGQDAENSHLNASEMALMQHKLDKVVVGIQQKTCTLLRAEDEEEVFEDMITVGERSKRAYWDQQTAKVARPVAAISQSTKGKKSPTKRSEKQSQDKAALLAAATKATSLRDEAGTVLSTTVASFEALPAESKIMRPSIIDCTSSKLSALISLLATSKKCPTLIFSSQDNSLHEMSALFDVLSRSDPWFQHRIFTSGVPQRRLDEYLQLFKSGKIDVLLIKTDRGGRGLDLHRAHRVIFVEPEVSASLERQAVKRAWRQGQEVPVDVYYLYVKGTFEEEITKVIKKKGQEEASAEMQAAVANDPGGVASLLQNPVMRDFLAHPRYIEGDAEEVDTPTASSSFAFPLFKQRSASHTADSRSPDSNLRKRKATHSPESLFDHKVRRLQVDSIQDSQESVDSLQLVASDSTLDQMYSSFDGSEDDGCATPALSALVTPEPSPCLTDVEHLTELDESKSVDKKHAKVDAASLRRDLFRQTNRTPSPEPKYECQHRLKSPRLARCVRFI